MKHIFTITFLLLTISLSAQTARIAEANEAFEKENYETCIQLYLEILDRKDLNEAKVNLAESYRRIDNWYEADYWYGQIVNLPDAKSIHFLYYGQALQANGKCDLAIEYFEEYSKLAPDDLRGQLLSKACTQDVLCPNITWLCKDCYEIELIAINSKMDDYSPTIYKKKLVFASEHNIFDHRRLCTDFTRPETNLLITTIDTLDSFNYEYLYDTLNLFFSEKENNIGSFVFLNESQVYSTQMIIKENEFTRLKIIEGNLVNNEWEFKDDFPYNSDKHSVAHPTFTSSGDTIYFASDMPGGFGGMDLYYSILNNGNWSKPINLGEIVNTEGHEVFPFYHSSTNKLYFSSDGQFPNKGGLDIYSTKIGYVNKDVVHLGSPLNTSSDDHGLTLNEAGTFGYFSSDRAGGIGQDDIYSFRVRQVNYQIIVADAMTLEPIENAKIEIVLSSNSHYKMKTNAFGKISIALGLADCKTFTISAKGYQLAENEICTTKKMENSIQEILILLEK